VNPTVQQQAVIDSDRKEILVEAGAGSGKTTTIVERYIRLIRGKLEPHNILVFTFTDKAAGELRNRIRDARSDLAKAAGEENPEAVSTSDSWIGTFHSICSRILRAYPVDAGVDPRFSVLDDTATETLKQNAFGEALRNFRDTDPEGRDPFLATYQVYRLRDTITHAYEELRSRGIESPTLPPFERSSYPAEDLEFLKAAARETAELRGLNHNYRKKAEAIEELLAPGIEGITYDDLVPLCFSAKTEGVERFCEVLDRALHSLIATEVGDDYREFMALLLEEYGDAYSRMKNLRSALDYEDLQLATLRLLRKNPPIRDDYRRRFREIMVDEFQDTNPLQLELVSLLKADDATLLTVGDEMQSIYGFRHADVELFRARRADPAVTTYPLSENFRSQGPVIGAINEIGGALDGQVSRRAGDERAGRHHFAELSVGLTEEEPSSVGLVLTGRDGWKQEELGPLAPAIPPEQQIGKEVDHFNEAEALRVAQMLRDLVDDPDNDIRQGDIAILLRAKTRTDIFVSALSQVGLTPYVVAGTGFWKKPEAIEVVSLLSVVANPRDDNHLLGALTSPACALSTDALWLLKKAAPDFEPLWPTVRAFVAGKTTGNDLLDQIPRIDLDRLSAFVSTVEHLRTQRSILPLDELVELAVTETGYDLAILYRDETANGLANVRRVESLARSFEANNGRDLRAFLEWVALSEELDSEASVATADENSDVVRLMTVHAAKGLEFKVVCVPDLSRQNTSRHDTQLRFGRSDDNDPQTFEVGLRVPRFESEKNAELYAWKELAVRAKRSTEDEELRLLHVAMTRAENHLIMSGVLPGKWPGQWKDEGTLSESTPMITRMSCAFGLDPTDPEAWPEAVPDGTGGGVVIGVTKNLPGPEQAESLRKTHDRLLVETRSLTGKPPLGRPPARVYPDVPLSFTAISEYADCPARFYAKRVLRLREPDGPPVPFGERPEMLVERDHGREFGNAVHDVLEALAPARWPVPDDDAIRRALEQHGLDPDEKDRQTRARRMIDGLRESELGRRVRSGSSRAEVPILLQSESVLIRGFIDLVVEGGPRPLIVDYKTNRLDGSTPQQKMSGYELQRGMYSLALASSSAAIEEVDTAWVFLEEPDSPVEATLAQNDLEAVREQVAGIVGEIVAGRPAAESADRRACGECWACRRLGSGTPVPATLF
jgi:ATP-dependent helicase/nuclease subunit A